VGPLSFVHVSFTNFLIDGGRKNCTVAITVTGSLRGRLCGDAFFFESAGERQQRVRPVGTAGGAGILGR
jgi:hypothetical protein